MLIYKIKLYIMMLYKDIKDKKSRGNFNINLITTFVKGNKHIYQSSISSKKNKKWYIDHIKNKRAQRALGRSPEEKVKRSQWIQ